MLLRPFLNDATSCASYLFGCTSQGTLAVVDPHVELVDRYLATADEVGHRIAPSSRRMSRPTTFPGCPSSRSAPARRPICPPMPALSSRTQRSPAATWSSWGTRTCEHWRRRGTRRLITPTSSRICAAARARILHTSLRRRLGLPDGVVVLPSHCGGSVCGRGLSSNPISTIGFERANNRMAAFPDADRFAEALATDMPQPPPEQARIIAANRRGAAGAPA